MHGCAVSVVLAERVRLPPMRTYSEYAERYGAGNRKSRNLRRTEERGRSMSKWAGRRRKLAEARAAVQKDAEAWIRIALAIEGLAAWLKPNGGGGLASALTTIRCTLFSDNEWTSAGPQGGPSPEVLGERLRLARNAQVHEGALARSTAGPAIALSLIIEGKLMEKDGQGAGTIEAWMVPKPQIAEGYETLSEIRSRMVNEGFSYLPWWNSRRGWWEVVRDVDLIEALAGAWRQGDDIGRGSRRARWAPADLRAGRVRTEHLPRRSPQSTPAKRRPPTAGGVVDQTEEW